MRRIFLTFILVCLVLFQIATAQEKKLIFKEVEKIGGEFIDNISPGSLSIQPEGNIIINWKKQLGDSTLNRKYLLIRDKIQKKWFQAELFNNGNNLCIGTESVFDTAGNLNMLVGERSRNLLSGRSVNMNRLSYFQYSSQVWSPVEQVFNINIHDCKHGFSQSKLLLDNQNVPSVFFISALDTVSNRKLLSCQRINGVWSEKKPIADIPANFEVMIDKNNVYHVGIIKGALGKGLDMNSVFYSFSRNGGKGYSEPVLVHKSGKMSAQDIAITIDTNNIRHIVFSKNLNKELFPDAIFHTYSKDGIEWSDSIKVSVGINGNCIKPCVVIDSKNNLHLFWEWSPNLFNKPSGILYSTFNEVKWSTPVLIAEKATSPAVYIDKKDFIHLVYKDLSQSKKNIYAIVYMKTEQSVTE